MIEGVWYYFKPNGYMAANEYIDGYWLNKNGSWTYKRKAKWHKYKEKWWYGDSSGWYAANQKLRIDGVLYTFDKEGYLVE